MKKRFFLITVLCLLIVIFSSVFVACDDTSSKKKEPSREKLAAALSQLTEEETKIYTCITGYWSNFKRPYTIGVSVISQKELIGYRYICIYEDNSSGRVERTVYKILTRNLEKTDKDSSYCWTYKDDSYSITNINKVLEEYKANKKECAI